MARNLAAFCRGLVRDEEGRIERVDDHVITFRGRKGRNL